MNPRLLRILTSFACLGLLTFAARAVPVNSTTVGFAYLLLVLVVASTRGFIEAVILSIAATLTFNFFFFPPFGTFVIAGAENWVALFTFLVASLIASRLSTEAKRRALDAVERQQDIERLYTFSRAILLIDNSEPFPAQLVRKLAEIFELDFALMYDRRTGDFYRAGTSEVKGIEGQLREVALDNIPLSSNQSCAFAAIRLGSEPIASLAIQGGRMPPDSVFRGMANLVAIGLERARAQDLAHEIEATRRSEQLRKTLMDATAHEFKTPLTSIKGATSLLLAGSDQTLESRMEVLRIADEETQRLSDLVDDTLAIGRLDSGHIKVNPETSNISELVDEIIGSLKTELQGRSLEVIRDKEDLTIVFDRHLIKLALRQLIDNALKYSPQGTPLRISLCEETGAVTVAVTDRGKGIPAQEQNRVFERYYRSPSVRHQIPGSGLGLSIAQSIVRAHGGELDLLSGPDETTFRIVLPKVHKGEHFERGSNSGNRR